MNRRFTILELLAFLVMPLGSVAQQQGKVWRIGMLKTTSMTMNAANVNAFRKAMREFGYVEGRNLAIDICSAHSNPP